MALRHPRRGDALLRTLASQGRIGIRALDATALVNEASARHGSSPLATSALGRTLMGAVLLASLGKSEESVQIRFRGNGPLGMILAMADCEGRARGYLSNPSVSLPNRGDPRGGQLDLSRAVGLGQLAVVRHRPAWREPYTGIVPIVSGEIAEDLALYLTESEQTPSAVGLGVRLDSDGSVAAAGGFLAQALPGADDTDLAQLEANVRDMPPVSEIVQQQRGAEAILEALTRRLGRSGIEESEPTFHCGCTDERVLRAVSLLGRDEIRDLCQRRQEVEVRCEFCAEQYRVDPERARALLADA